MKPWWRRVLLERGGGLALAVAALYVCFATPYIVENDNAEFATLGAVGGIAHPSGYPSYILWLRTWSWLPASTPAHAAALATALLGVLQVLVLHAACRAWGVRHAAATLVVGVFATVPLVARYNTEAEAFALNTLVVALVLWLAALRGPLRGSRRAFALGLVAGIGLANHMTCSLAAPVGLLGVVRAGRESRLARAWSLAVLGLVLGLTPYLYLFVAPETPISWPRPTSFGELSDIILRRQFGGPFGFTGFVAERPWLEHLSALAETLARSWLWIGLPVGLTMLAACSTRRDLHEPRVSWLMLASCFVLSGPFLVTRFDIPLNMYGTYVAQRFYLLPIVFLVIPVALAVDTGLRRFARPVHIYALAGALFVGGVVRLMPYLQRFQSPAMETEVAWMLKTLPSNAVVLGRDDELDVGTRYLQLARGLREDVTFIRWGTMSLDWYRAHFKDIPFTPTTPGDLKLDVARAVLTSGRPLFVSAREIVGFERFATYPYGILVRVLPDGESAPSLDEVVAINLELFNALPRDYVRPGPSDQYASWVHRNYAYTWKVIGDTLARTGRHRDAENAYAVMRDLGPRE